MTDTRRTQALEAIKASFVAMAADAPVGDPYGVAWSVVSRDPLAKIPAGKKNALGVYGGTSTRTSQTYGKTVTMPVIIEIYTKVQSGRGKAEYLEYLLGVVERRLLEDQTMGGTIVDLNVTGEQVNIDSPYEDQVDAALFLEVKYMQSERDPRMNRGG